MIDPKDPPRLLDPASGAPVGLRDVLRAAERDVGSVAQIARLSERLGPLLATPSPTPPAKAPSGMSAAAKVGLSALALLLAGGGAWLLSTSQSAAPPAPSSPALPTPPALPPVAPAQEQSAPSAGARSPAAAPSEAAPEPGASKPEPPAPGEKPVQLSEAELLEQARAALRSDPARALARANEHRRRFPGGVLVQEREVIAIKALRQLGRGSEADQRAAAFEKAFPGSAFQRKLKPSP